MFECPLDTAKLKDKLERLWLPLLNLKKDSLRVYSLDATVKQ
ncbi:CRISPR-associated endonuclease Cas2 [Synechococcus sp. H55.10]